MDVRCFSPKEINVCYPPRERCRAQEALERIEGVKVCSFGEREIGDLKVLGIGFRGIVLYGFLKGIPVAIKLPRADWNGSLSKEGYIQKLAYPVAPKVYTYNDDVLVMEYIGCPDISDVILERLGDREALRDVVVKALVAGRELDKRGIDHGELVRPWKHVKVCNRARIIDFGSASLTRRPRNVTSLVSGLILKPSYPADAIARALNINKAIVIERLKSYKREMSDEAFKELLRAITS